MSRGEHLVKAYIFALELVEHVTESGEPLTREVREIIAAAILQARDETGRPREEGWHDLANHLRLNEGINAEKALGVFDCPDIIADKDDDIKELKSHIKSLEQKVEDLESEVHEKRPWRPVLNLAEELKAEALMGLMDKLDLETIQDIENLI